ncbi:MAG TPA: DegT/DnrJ/EryC1/StrS family aminotransferase [Gemmatimonadaceae bacterium]|nr:DegT/DnrJ/EryC1/StrS family aminotransferase [Gemmatimonadaceae bacterium]
MTLGHDDLAIAERCLKNRAQWADEAPVTAFERAFAEWNGSRHAFAFLGGRVAFSACLAALELPAGTEVIVPGYTCVVVPNAIRFAGAVPVFCDIELETYGPDVTDVARRITSRTGVLLLHHLFGLVCRDYDALIELARRRGLRVIEDCAHATGAEDQGVKVGRRGDLAFYSTERSKVLNTIRGGLAVTDDEELARGLAAYAERAPRPAPAEVERCLRTVRIVHDRAWHPRRGLARRWAQFRDGRHEAVSTTSGEIRGERPTDYGQRLPAPLAELGLNQLAKLDQLSVERRRTAVRWDAWCRAMGYAPPFVREGSLPVFLRYPVLVEAERKRDGGWARRELGIDLGVWFVSPIHPAPFSLPDCPRAMEAVQRCVNFPTLLPSGASPE